MPEPWAPYPYDPDEFDRDLATLRVDWPQLHASDAEPWPRQPQVQRAWQLYHAGRFAQAFEAGLAAGGDGITVANRAQSVHAIYLCSHEDARLQALREATDRAAQQVQASPSNANAHFALAFALARRGQTVNVARAMSEGQGRRARIALQVAIALAPTHAAAHIALGSLHADVIDKVGRLLAATQGADTAAGLRMFQTGLKLDPGTVWGRIEYAQGLLMLEGPQRAADAERLLAEAAAQTPRDACERLEIALARAGLEL